MLKKLLLLFVVLCLSLASFTACNTPEESATEPPLIIPTKIVTTPPASTVVSTPTPSPTESNEVKEYTIDLDFQISERAFSIIFGYYDEVEFLLWQVNIYDFENDQKVTFKPHAWVDGNPQVLDQIEINNAIKWEDRNKTHHMKVVVNDKNLVTTYINDVKVYEYTDDLAKYNGIFGFRQCEKEAAYVDNIVIKNTATDTIISEYKFDADDNPFDEGEIKTGVMGNSPALYINALSSSAQDICILEK